MYWVILYSYTCGTCGSSVFCYLKTMTQSLEVLHWHHALICMSHYTMCRYVSCLFLYQTILIKRLQELCLVVNIFQVLPNGNLVFPPFRAEDYRQEVHAQVYVCLARNSVGSIHSRDVNVRAGEVQTINVEELRVDHLLLIQQISVYPSQ